MPPILLAWIIIVVAVALSSGLAVGTANSQSQKHSTSARLLFDRISSPPPETSVVLPPADGKLPDCAPPNITVTAMSAGRSEIKIRSICRRFEPIKLTYADVAFVRVLDQNGQFTFILDCFAGDQIPVMIEFSDGTALEQPLEALDLDVVTKVAVIWVAPVNLDLHAFEYSAVPESPDHVWAEKPRSERAARELAYSLQKRGHGFLSTSSNGREPGAKVEVYTFFRNREQKRGVINMALDYESRARDERSFETCGTGPYSELEYEAILFDRNRKSERKPRKFLAVDCSVRLSGINRLNHKTVPEIIIRN